MKLRHAMKSLWHAYCRRLDRKFIWPAIREISPNIEMARNVFMLHCIVDPAWRSMTDEQIANELEKLQ